MGQPQISDRQRSVRSPHGMAAGQLGVLLVDPLAPCRDGLAAVIADTPGWRVCGTATTARVAVELAQLRNPDIVVLDSALDPRGVVLRRMLAIDAGLTVVVAVGEADRTSAYLAEVIRAGARGMVRHGADPHELITGIQRAHQTGRFIDPALISLLDCVRPDRKPAFHPRTLLSTRELQILQLVADGLGNKAIGETLFVSAETVRTHMKSILRKLHARTRAHAVSVGYRTRLLPPESHP